MAKRNVSHTCQINWAKTIAGDIARDLIDEAICRAMISGAYYVAIAQMRAREAATGLREARAWSCQVPRPRFFRR